MENRPLVVLLGNSLLMDGVAVSLADKQMLRMVRIDTETEDIWERMESLRPELIVFELNNPDTPAIISLLKNRTDTLLIGLDLDCSRAFVLNSRQHLTRSMNDLYSVVQAAANLEPMSATGSGLESNNDKVTTA